jgi:pimeloyl-ACP methyl ester carboxylesterase
VREIEIDLPTVSLSYLEDGPADGPLAICLHGFPDSRASFRHLAPALVSAGYRVVMPALRGYGPSSVAKDGVYHSSALAHDVISLHDSCGGDERSIVVGHDWGAMATYLAVAAAPERFRRAVTMAVPPLGAMAGAMLRFDQLQRSWYMWLFQLPFADYAVSANDSAFLDRLWEQWSPGYDGREDVALVKAALDSPERIAAAIGYYRAMFTPTTPPAPYEQVFASRDAALAIPFLYLHGRNDGCVAELDFDEVRRHLPENSAVHVIEDAGHFMHLERPDEIAHLVLDFLAS